MWCVCVCLCACACFTDRGCLCGAYVINNRGETTTTATTTDWLATVFRFVSFHFALYFASPVVGGYVLFMLFFFFCLYFYFCLIWSFRSPRCRKIKSTKKMTKKKKRPCAYFWLTIATVCAGGGFANKTVCGACEYECVCGGWRRRSCRNYLIIVRFFFCICTFTLPALTSRLFNTQ